MATKPSTIDFLLDQFRGSGGVSAKKMFGEYALYLYERVFALVCHDQLFVKITDAGARLYPEGTLGVPYPGAKPCFLISPDRWDDDEWLSELAVATASALPLPAKKSRRKLETGGAPQE